MKQVWRCSQGHEVVSPDRVKYVAVTCGICAKQNPTRRDIREGSTKWEMTLVKGPKAQVKGSK